MYYTEFGINLKFACALSSERGVICIAAGLFSFQIIVRLVAFLFAWYRTLRLSLFYLDSECHLSGMVIVEVFMEHVG